MKPIQINGNTVLAVEVKLPKANLLAITSDNGYIMCGALDVSLLNERLSARGIIAGWSGAIVVKTLNERLEGHSTLQSLLE